MTTPRPADRITALAGSVDLSGFAPFLSPVMFFSNENPWPTLTLLVSLAAILLVAFMIFGSRRRRSTGFEPVPVNTRIRRAWLAALRRESEPPAWR